MPLPRRFTRVRQTRPRLPECRGWEGLEGIGRREGNGGERGMPVTQAFDRKIDAIDDSSDGRWRKSFVAAAD